MYQKVILVIHLYINSMISNEKYFIVLMMINLQDPLKKWMKGNKETLNYPIKGI